MQTKGFIVTITAALILVCAFYLSFSFVTNHYESEAQRIALKKAGIKSPDTSNDKYRNAYNEYISGIEKKKVYLGYTYQEVREKQLGLGLDLKGGMNVTLQISVPDILRALSGDNKDPKFNKAIETIASQAQQEDFVGAFCKEYKRIAPEGNLAQVFRSMEKVKDKPDATDAQVEAFLKEEVDGMVDNSYKVLRTRIDKFGVVAPNIQKLQSTGRILLELPGIKEPERVRKLLQGTANLEFYTTYSGNSGDKNKSIIINALNEISKNLANDSTANAAAGGKTLMEMITEGTSNGSAAIVGCTASSDTAAVNAILRSDLAKRYLPSDAKLLWGVKPEGKANKGNAEIFELYALKTVDGKASLTGDVVTEARAELETKVGRQEYAVSMRMNNEGSQQWSTITGQNKNHAVAIVLDDQVYSAPNVMNQIDGGNSQITGNFTVEEANDLANVLQSGKMVARVNIASESVIGPSLGQEAINKGLISFVVALVLLMIFMVMMYGFQGGSIANLGLLMNLFFTAGILASFQSVLTLPGIAGIVLALGMAVDANVLIFERIKEELRGGKNLKASIQDGYGNAFSAIFDSNLTSIITGIILAILGTGPIKGFAITLIIGICCSFFTAVFATRVVLEWLVKRGTFANMTLTTSLSKNMMQNVKYDFMGKAKSWSVVVIAVVLIAGGMLAWRGLSMGIDFSGGRNYIVQFDHPVSTAALQKAVAAELSGANSSVITIDNNTKVRVSTNYLINNTDPKKDVDKIIMDKLYKALKPELKNMSYEDFSVSNESVGVVQSEQVGPSIAKDMTLGAIYAVLFSLLAMALYILLRFRNIAFSIGALAAVAFTSFTVIAVYTIHGWLPFSMEIDQTFIAAILTVIGYQVNDTVVVFDRVREYRELYPKQPLYDTFNRALCSTLSRTLMTSITTLLVLLVIFFLGGESIRSFVFAMILGVIIGTTASLFIASPVAYSIAKRSQKKVAEPAKNKKK